MTAVRSIHHRRRGFYMLWVSLLLLSLVALVLWESPKSSGTMKVVLSVKVRGLPEGAQARIWTGPSSRWMDANLNTDGQPMAIRGSEAIAPLLILPVSYRRWVQGYIPRRTADLLVVCLMVPDQPTRYLAYSMGGDLRSGWAGPGRILKLNLECAWEKLASRP